MQFDDDFHFKSYIFRLIAEHVVKRNSISNITLERTKLTGHMPQPMHAVDIP